MMSVRLHIAEPAASAPREQSARVRCSVSRQERISLWRDPTALKKYNQVLPLRDYSPKCARSARVSCRNATRGAERQDRPQNQPRRGPRRGVLRLVLASTLEVWSDRSIGATYGGARTIVQATHALWSA